MDRIVFSNEEIDRLCAIRTAIPRKRIMPFGEEIRTAIVTTPTRKALPIAQGNNKNFLGCDSCTGSLEQCYFDLIQPYPIFPPGSVLRK